MKKWVVLFYSILASCQPLPTGGGSPYDTPTHRLSSHDEQVNRLLAQMTLEEKIGQMTQADQKFLVDEADIERYFLGSLLSGGDSDPPTNSLEDWVQMYNRYQSRARRTRLGIPLLYGVDAVHGHSNVLGAVVFPHNIGLGATGNPDLVKEVYRLSAREVRATGINWSFAPCVAVPRDERWGRTYEGFSEAPGVVAEMGAAAVEGLQGSGLGDPVGVLACAKHFVGDGGTVFGTGLVREDGSGKRWPLDRGDTRLDENTLREIHMQGYISAIRSGVGSIMVSFNSWNGVKCSGSRRLLTEILKEELGFEGFLVSDWGAINDLPGDYKSDVEQSINAGMDMVMVPDRYPEFFKCLQELVQEGKIHMDRIDDAVRRILRVKFALGLMDPKRSPLADRTLSSDFGSQKHREVARQAVRQSLVLLKNKDGRLPLSKEMGRIHVAGKNADNLGHQCGGWTIEWQGGDGEITQGTTILEAIQNTVLRSTKVTFSIDGSGAAGADVGILVIGETPYAEWFGDREDLWPDREDILTVERVHRAGVPIVVVLISGRPLDIRLVLEQSDAFVAAWLPGSEGQGVADVLFGEYPPTGKLSFTWPRSSSQVPINLGDSHYDPLFKYGFGLTY